MSPNPSPTKNFPHHPLITPPPSSSASRKRRRTSSPAHNLFPRQTIFNQTGIGAAESECADTGNEIISCFPNAGASIPQHQEAFFVWNSRRPQLAQTNLVNIYLIRAGSDVPVLSWLNVQNPTNGDAGNIGAVVNDSWFPSGGTSWSGSNLSFPLYFVLTRADQTLDGSQVPQATFSAVQTTFADAVASSMSVASASASAASVSASIASVASVASKSAASVSSVSAASAASRTASGASSTTAGSANLQPSGNASNFPHWAIAVIVVLGFLAIVAICALVFLIMRRLRQRQQFQSSQRNSMGSASPMIPGGAGAAAHGGGPQSPQMEETRRLFEPAVVGAGHASLNSPNDDASMISHAQSQAHSTGDSGLFSGADAAIMADAFRKVLRKPDFAGRPPIEEGESPDGAEHEPKPEHRLMNWELAEEGRDIRSVGSSRGVRVEGVEDEDGTSTTRGTQ